MEVFQLSVALTSGLTMLMIIAFFSTKKFLHPLEQLFIFFLLVLGYTSFVSIININLELWEVSLQDLVAFRLNEMVYVPLTILWFIDLWQKIKRNLYRRVLLLIWFLILLYIGDYILRFYSVYQYHNWNNMILGTVWILICVISLFAQQLFRLLLKKEGIV